MTKTEVVVFTNRYKFDVPRIVLDGQAIQPKNDMKYLGMVVERSPLFKAHVEAAANKAEKMANALGRLMPNLGGPKEARRSCLYQSQCLFSSTVHHPGREQCLWFPGIRLL